MVVIFQIEYRSASEVVTESLEEVPAQKKRYLIQIVQTPYPRADTS
jgi:hypothetical protein